MRNYVIIHGSFSNPHANWFGWLADYLRSKNEFVYVPQFPTGVGLQNYNNWSKLLKYYYNLGLINENTIIIAHSIGPVFVSKFLVKNNIKIKKLISVCGFNNYFIDKDFDEVNRSMFFKNLKDVKNFAKEIICIYSDNDPYVSFEVEKSFADIVATKQVLLKGAGHINQESGFTSFNQIIKYL